jgi:adenylate cyclase
VEQDSAAKLSAEELSSATGEAIERVRHWRSLELLGSHGEGAFARDDIERVRLIQFLERREIEPEALARAERDEAVLSSVMQLLFPRGAPRTYSFAQAIDIVGMDPEFARRLRDASGAGGEPMDEHDLQMLRRAKAFLDAGFPESALRQLIRVYADSLRRVAEAEVRLFHFYVHEALKTAGWSGRDLLDRRRSAQEHLLPVAEPLIRYFHRRGVTKAVREDMVSACHRRPGSRGAPRSAGPAALGHRVPGPLELHPDHRAHGRRRSRKDRGALLRTGAGQDHPR